MNRRRTMILALAVALAFAGSAGPRHARAAAQDHHPAATQHHQHSHDHGSAAASEADRGGTHDHVGGQPASDQGCCYAWCNSAAIIHAADGLLIHTAHDEHFASERPIRIVAFSAAIDPPPR